MAEWQRSYQEDVTLTFQPGKLGLDADWTTGRITVVHPGQQAQNFGVQVGWTMTKINGQIYSEPTLDRCIQGRQAYYITFSGKGPPPPARVGSSPPRTSTTSGSSSWKPEPSTWTFPGYFRRARSRMSGPKAMDNDPLESSRQEIAAFDESLARLLDTAQRVSTAVDMLASAPEQLGEALLQQFPIGHHPGGELISRLNNQTIKFAVKVKDGDPLIKAAIEGTCEMRKLNQEAKEHFKKRDSAWEVNKHYDEKINKLRDTATRASSVSNKMQNKISRNTEKHYNSEQEFQQVFQVAAKTAQEVLETKWSKVGQVLSNLCKFYIAVFEGAHQMLNELSNLGEEFVGNSPGQGDFARQAQAMGQQAKERMSGFANSAKEKFDNTRGNLDGMFRGGSSSSTASPKANSGWNMNTGVPWGTGGNQANSPPPTPGATNPFDPGDNGNPFDPGDSPQDPRSGGKGGGGYAPRTNPSPWPTSFGSGQNFAPKGGMPWQTGQTGAPKASASPWAAAPKGPWNSGKGSPRR